MGMAGFGLLSQSSDKVAVAGKSVVIAGPPGYCVYAPATRDRDSGAFVLLGSCAAIARNRNSPTPETPAMLTASVSGISAAKIGNAQSGLRAFFRSEAGRATLARDGRATSVRILETRARGDAFYIHLSDSSDNEFPSLATDYWRGLFDVRGRIVTFSVHSFSDEPMTSRLELATLDAFAVRIRNENPPAPVVLVEK